MKKKLAAILAILMLAASLTACGGNGGTAAPAEAKVVNMFLTPAQLEYRNMRPDYNYYLTAYSMEELTLLDDGTYCLQLMSATFSALELAESTSDAKGNERLNQVVKIYGTYTSKPNEFDDYYLDVTLSAPTRAVSCYDQTYWLDTANWTEEMGKRVRPATSYDPTTGAPVVDPESPALSAEDYLKTITFQGAEIQANQKSATFDFIDMGIRTIM